MTQKRVVGMRYRPTASNCRDMKERIGNATESVKSKYPVEAWLIQNDMMIHVELNVTIKAKQPGYLESALREFRSMVGDTTLYPRYILPFSDYAAVEKTFPEKDLKRKWFFPFGKYLAERKH